MTHYYRILQLSTILHAYCQNMSNHFGSVEDQLGGVENEMKMPEFFTQILKVQLLLMKKTENSRDTVDDKEYKLRFIEVIKSLRLQNNLESLHKYEDTYRAISIWTGQKNLYDWLLDSRGKIDPQIMVIILKLYQGAYKELRKLSQNHELIIEKNQIQIEAVKKQKLQDQLSKVKIENHQLTQRKQLQGDKNVKDKSKFQKKPGKSEPFKYYSAIPIVNEPQVSQRIPATPQNRPNAKPQMKKDDIPMNKTEPTFNYMIATTNVFVQNYLDPVMEEKRILDDIEELKKYGKIVQEYAEKKKKDRLYSSK